MRKIVFDFEQYKGKNVVVHCKTLQQARLWCRFMYKNGLKWSGGGSYLNNNNWYEYKEDTCYCFNDLQFVK